MILYKNTKVIFHLPDGDTNFFDIITVVIQVDNIGSMLIIC